VSGALLLLSGAGLVVLACAASTEIEVPTGTSGTGGGGGTGGGLDATDQDGTWFGGAGGSGGTSGTSGTGGTGGSAVASCQNGAKDGSESDVDCGGSCPACPLGKACGMDSDCNSNHCLQSKCCMLTTYDKSTGNVSGTGDVCCDGNDTRKSYSDCASGANHGVDPLDPNCAHAWEGAGNGGSACAKITCEKQTCG
jgi:hypothetical protein